MGKARSEGIIGNNRVPDCALLLSTTEEIQLGWLLSNDLTLLSLINCINHYHSYTSGWFVVAM